MSTLLGCLPSLTFPPPRTLSHTFILPYSQYCILSHTDLRPPVQLVWPLSYSHNLSLIYSHIVTQTSPPPVYFTVASLILWIGPARLVSPLLASPPQSSPSYQAMLPPCPWPPPPRAWPEERCCPCPPHCPCPRSGFPGRARPSLSGGRYPTPNLRSPAHHSRKYTYPVLCPVASSCRLVT